MEANREHWPQTHVQIGLSESRSGSWRGTENSLTSKGDPPSGFATIIGSSTWRHVQAENAACWHATNRLTRRVSWTHERDSSIARSEASMSEGECLTPARRSRRITSDGAERLGPRAASADPSESQKKIEGKLEKGAVHGAPQTKVIANRGGPTKVDCMVGVHRGVRRRRAQPGAARSPHPFLEANVCDPQKAVERVPCRQRGGSN